MYHVSNSTLYSTSYRTFSFFVLYPSSVLRISRHFSRSLIKRYRLNFFSLSLSSPNALKLVHYFPQQYSLTPSNPKTRTPTEVHFLLGRLFPLWTCSCTYTSIQLFNHFVSGRVLEELRNRNTTNWKVVMKSWKFSPFLNIRCTDSVHAGNVFWLSET